MTDAQAKKPRVIILAGNFWQAQNYADEHNISSLGLMIPTHENELKGIRGATVYRVGTWIDRHYSLIAAVDEAEQPDAFKAKRTPNPRRLV